jgi:hypothetical protein
MPGSSRALVLFWLTAFACTPDPSRYDTSNAPFTAPIALGEVTDERLAEVSGLVASRKNPGMLWVHNDSGNKTELYLISTQGKLLATYYLDQGVNFDWEDIAIGPGPEAGETYLYLGDIGDNTAMYDERYVYRFVEPTYAEATTIDTIANYDRLGFFYREGAVNAETLLLDPLTQNLFVLSKESDQIRVHQFRYPPAPPFRQPAKLMTTLSFGGFNLLDQLVAGDISADGTEVLLKTYEHVLYWNRKDASVSIPELLRLPADTLPYWPEPQGEAIGFAADGSGYYTLSEENLGADIYLYFYPRSSHDSTQTSPETDAIN